MCTYIYVTLHIYQLCSQTLTYTPVVLQCPIHCMQLWIYCIITETAAKCLYYFRQALAGIYNCRHPPPVATTAHLSIQINLRVISQESQNFIVSHSCSYHGGGVLQSVPAVNIYTCIQQHLCSLLLVAIVKYKCLQYVVCMYVCIYRKMLVATSATVLTGELLQLVSGRTAVTTVIYKYEYQ